MNPPSSCSSLSSHHSQIRAKLASSCFEEIWLLDPVPGFQDSLVFMRITSSQCSDLGSNDTLFSQKLPKIFFTPFLSIIHSQSCYFALFLLRTGHDVSSSSTKNQSPHEKGAYWLHSPLEPNVHKQYWACVSIYRIENVGVCRS